MPISTVERSTPFSFAHRFMSASAAFLTSANYFSARRSSSSSLLGGAIFGSSARPMRMTSSFVSSWVTCGGRLFGALTVQSSAV